MILIVPDDPPLADRLAALFDALEERGLMARAVLVPPSRCLPGHPRGVMRAMGPGEFLLNGRRIRLVEAREDAIYDSVSAGIDLRDGWGLGDLRAIVQREKERESRQRFERTRKQSARGCARQNRGRR